MKTKPELLLFISAIFFTLLFFAQLSYAQRLYVKQSASGKNDGSSWTDAYTDLQSALEHKESCDEIWVARGVYKPSKDENGLIPVDSREKTFVLQRKLAIYGGFEGDEDELSDRMITINQTTLSGDIGTNASSDNCYHILYNGEDVLDQETIIDGFTITGGNANGNSHPNNKGGALYLSNSYSQPVIRNCTFIGNNGNSGGAIFIAAGSEPVIELSRFMSNTATNDGGALYNSAQSAASVLSCTFSANTAGINGGAVYNNSDAITEIKNSEFVNNAAATSGGAIFNYQRADIIVQNSIFDNNAAEQGGALYNESADPVIQNTLFKGNNAGMYGGGMYNYSTYTSAPSEPVIQNCTFINNESQYLGGGISSYDSSPTIQNCIFWGNEAPINGNSFYNSDNASATLEHSIVEESGAAQLPRTTFVEVLFGVNPLFTDYNGDDFTLLPQSPARDYGMDIIRELPETDLAGNKRLYNQTLDLGAYEIQNIAPNDILLSNNQVYEDEPPGLFVGTFTASDPNDTETHTFSLIAGEGDTDNAKFTLSGDTLKTAVVIDREQQTTCSIRVKATDNGDGNLSYEKQFTIDVLLANILPTSEDQSRTIEEDASYNFSSDDFVFNDTNSEHSLEKIQIVALPQDGNFTKKGQAIVQNQEINTENIGEMTFSPLENENGEPYSDFQFKIFDGLAYSEQSYTFTINVSPINDKPLGRHGSIELYKNTQYQFSTDDFYFEDADVDDTFAGIEVVTEETAGDLEYDGNHITAFQECPDVSKLVFTPETDATGADYSYFFYRIKDSYGEFSNDIYSMNISVLPNDVATTIYISSASIDENVPVGTLVGTFTNNDSDASDTYTYSFASGDGTNDADNNNFVIINDELHTDTDIDYESQQAYNIYIQVSDGKGGICKQSFLITVIDDTNETGIYEATKEQFVVYPNPATEKLMLHIPGLQENNKIEEISLHSVNGQIVKKIQSIDDRQAINITSLKKGIYVLKIQLKSNKTITKKIVIQ